MSEELIGQLDPKRDYGRLSYDVVVDRIRSGRFLIQQGETLPVIRHALTGEVVKGSGVPGLRMPAASALRREMRDQLAQQTQLRWPRIMKALLDQAEGGSVKALQLLIETVIGRPDINRSDEASTALRELLARGLLAYRAETQPPPEVRVVEVTSRDVD